MVKDKKNEIGRLHAELRELLAQPLLTVGRNRWGVIINILFFFGVMCVLGYYLTVFCLTLFFVLVLSVMCYLAFALNTLEWCCFSSVFSQ